MFCCVIAHCDVSCVCSQQKRDRLSVKVNGHFGACSCSLETVKYRHKKGALALAKERMEEILTTRKPKPLTPEQDKAIDEVLKEASSFYRHKGCV